MEGSQAMVQIRSGTCLMGSEDFYPEERAPFRGSGSTIETAKRAGLTIDEIRLLPQASSAGLPQ